MVSSILCWTLTVHFKDSGLKFKNRKEVFHNISITHLLLSFLGLRVP